MSPAVALQRGRASGVSNDQYEKIPLLVPFRNHRSVAKLVYIHKRKQNWGNKFKIQTGLPQYKSYMLCSSRHPILSRTDVHRQASLVVEGRGLLSLSVQIPPDSWADIK